MTEPPNNPNTQPPPQPIQRGKPISRAQRNLVGRAFAVICILVAVTTAAILAVLLSTIAIRGWGMLFESWSFPFIRTEFFTNSPSRNPQDAGIMPGLWGTIIICAVCAAAAIPLGVATAIFLEEFRPKHRLARPIHAFFELNIRNLAGVPSIVYGLLGLTIFVNMFGLFGGALNPNLRIGVNHFDEFFTLNDKVALVRVDNAQAPPTIPTDTTNARFEDGTRITLVPLTAQQQLAIEQAGEPFPPGAIDAEEPPYRLESRAWYYLQLPFGRSALAGGLTLMLVILPVVIIAAAEALRAVPNSLREGALAAGATRWQVVRTMTLPCAIPGIMTGSILAMSRAIGETAPIIVVGAVVSIRHRPENLMDPFSALPMQIFDWTGRPNDEFRDIAASAIIVLLAILLAFNITATIIRQIFTKPLQ